MITPESLQQILPNCKDVDGWSFELESVLPNFGIERKEEIASFLSQVGHESGHLNILEENLNYSIQGLTKTFKKYFPDEAIAKRYARQPKAIASRVYAGRMGNGSEQSQEGWKFRGRGILQVTGKNNYRRCSMFLFEDERLLDDPDILLTQEYALASACWFWEENDLNQYAGDVKRVTRLVNGGYHGLADREEIYKRAMTYL